MLCNSSVWIFYGSDFCGINLHICKLARIFYCCWVNHAFTNQYDIWLWGRGKYIWSYFNIVTAYVRLGTSVEREIESNWSSTHRLGLRQGNTGKLGWRITGSYINLWLYNCYSGNASHQHQSKLMTLGGLWENVTNVGRIFLVPKKQQGRGKADWLLVKSGVTGRARLDVSCA